MGTVGRRRRGRHRQRFDGLTVVVGLASRTGSVSERSARPRGRARCCRPRSGFEVKSDGLWLHSSAVGKLRSRSSLEVRSPNWKSEFGCRSTSTIEVGDEDVGYDGEVGPRRCVPDNREVKLVKRLGSAIKKSEMAGSVSGDCQVEEVRSDLLDVRRLRSGTSKLFWG
ncbi:ATP-dependent Clp protease proteolytic subunit [Striga asiatica]|uniref:ATP-dependent Clp protease proteolytic subunit n=1 Tax=Striga asiatica TaxID=4170 RepID=A0A5A7QGJ6_STRAF|nr:ATP-dependent Clp protease proteolytic subunit [Striga asiatica]